MASNGAAQLINNLLMRKKLSGGLVEYRTIHPIGTALEIQSYKTALQLCAKALKKQPDHYTVLALKVVALAGPRPVSAQARQEILGVIEYVKTHANGAGLGDSDVLLLFGWALDVLGEGQATLDLLTVATQRHPDNEEVTVEAFLHYVRAGERRSAQQASLRLQKNFKSDKYLWWSVASILLQARDPTNASNDLLLSIAERQITAHFTEAATAAGVSLNTLGQPGIEATGVALATADKGKGKEDAGALSALPTSSPATPSEPTLEYESAHEFFLVTRLLELRVQQAGASPDKSTVVAASTTPSPSLVVPSLSPSATSSTPREILLAHFSSKEADKWCDQDLGLEIWRREVELKHGTVEGGEWRRSWTRLQQSLVGGDTNWHTMLYLIRVAFSIADGSSTAFFGDASSGSAPSDEGVTILADSRKLFATLSEDSEKGKVERGYLLGLLEISREERRRKWSEEEPLAPLVERYFERFSTKMCCFDDLHPYLRVLTVEEAQALHSTLVQTTQGAFEPNEKKSIRLINGLRLSRFLASGSSEQDQVDIAQAFVGRYFEALPLGKGLAATDLQPADDFALLAGQALVAAWHHSKDSSYLEQALAVLDYAAQRSKHKYQIRILIVNICRHLGASSLALTHFRILGAKAIQHDTLSHLVLTRASTFAVASGTDAGVFEEALVAGKWYRSGENEAADMAVRVFNFQCYSKIEDFIVFQDRLSRSLNKYLLQVETLRMRVLRGLLDEVSTKAGVEQLAYILAAASSFIDNRDFKTLPNMQASGQASIWDQTSMGPRTATEWLRTLATIYTRFLSPQSSSGEDAEVESAELTISELALLSFSKTSRLALEAALDEPEKEEAAIAFFKESATRITEAIDDSKRLPWEILHIAEVALEGYCLLDIAIDLRTNHLSATKAPDHAKHGKRLRNFRTAAREATRTVGARVTAYGKKVAKQRPKTVTSISSLSQFPLLDNDHLMTFAQGLVESRRAMAEGLGTAIHRRCIK